MDLIQNRRRSFMNDEISFLNIVPYSQFNAPSYPGNQGLFGAAFSDDKSNFIMLAGGTAGTTPANQKRLYCYNNSNANGVIESPSDLTFIGTSNDMAFDISGVRQQIANGIYWNSTLGKIWAHGTTTTNMLVEYDFDITTLTVTMVQHKILSGSFDYGMFYFDPTGTLLFVSTTATVYKHILSTPFDISTAVFASSTAGNFTNAPFFYGNGGYAFHSVFAVGSGQSDIRKRQFTIPYDYTSIIGGSGYSQPFYRVIGGYRITAQLPILVSNDFKKINYFCGPNTVPGRIGVGEFDIKLKFLGNGDGLGGVKLGASVIT